MKYGDLPAEIGVFDISVREMMFYHDMPIKMRGMHLAKAEPRLNCFSVLISAACGDFIASFGMGSFIDHFVYVTAKNCFQSPGCSFNRPGYHADGFMSDDINYTWCNCNPTVFNNSGFNISQDDSLSMVEMELQALKENEVIYPDNTLLKLNQFNIHKVAEVKAPGLRAFVKVTFSKDKYDKIGNSHNYMLDYNWKMKARSTERNVPQSKL